ncbi:MAG: tRNA (N6-isopentenyl adenosine(37)-C2)-methylthiotransferase MiaB [Desulfobaccales bacterium]
MPVSKKKLYIRTFGCQMNHADSQQMARYLAPEYEVTCRAEEADLYLINSCAIRRKSEEKLKSLLGSLKFLKARNPRLILGVGGCVAQQEGERLLAGAPHLNLVFGTQTSRRLPELVRRATLGQRPAALELTRGLPQPPARLWSRGPAQTFVTIMQGCDNFCTYCVVPYVRGREASRAPEAIVAEVSGFLAAGGLEVTLLGQNVNSYGRGLPTPITFTGLLRRLAQLPGLARLRFATSHPRDLSAELLAALGSLPPLCEHLHLPVQSGSNRILQAMHRGYTREAYLERVDRLRFACPGIALSTDLIVGFPGETEADFAQTLDLMRQAAFEQAFSFKFSPRPQTRAADFPDQVPEAVKAERLARLQALQDELTLAANARLLGQIKEVLVEGASKRSPEQQLCGRLRTNQVVNFSGPRHLTGQLTRVAITCSHPHSLTGSWTQGHSWEQGRMPEAYPSQEATCLGK